MRFSPAVPLFRFYLHRRGRSRCWSQNSRFAHSVQESGLRLLRKAEGGGLPFRGLWEVIDGRGYRGNSESRAEL